MSRFFGVAAMHRKPHLPGKTCRQCQRPFAWQRKWARCWGEVRYCSERCRRKARQPGGAA